MLSFECEFDIQYGMCHEIETGEYQET